MQQLSEHPTDRPATTPAVDVVVLGDGGPDADELGRAIALAIGALPATVPVVDVWTDGRAAVERGVVSLPTAIAEVGGREVGRLVGRPSARRLARFVQQSVPTTALVTGGR